MLYLQSLLNIFFAAFCFSLSLFCLTAPINGNPLIAFFFDAYAISADEDGDGGHDYIYAQFDVDLDEDVTANVTVVAELYNQSGKIVATKSISYKVTGQETGYNSVKLIPSPDIEGVYNVHLTLSDKSDELYVEDVYYNPAPGSKPVAYFADATASSQLDRISLEFDVNMVQAVSSYVTVNASLVDSGGQTVDTQNRSYKTFFDDVDYKSMGFKPTVEDAYSIILTVYPAGGGVAADSHIINVLWPPGTGAYFRNYEAQAFDDRLELAFDVDLEYNITYSVAVEAILYNSDNDAISYGYTSYLTTGILTDEHKIILSPKTTIYDRYYVELVVYIEGYPASYGYIEDIPFGQPRWDVNGDNVVDVRDLVIVSREFGKKTSELENPMADVNIDGIVDILDLVIVGYHFGESW